MKMNHSKNKIPALVKQLKILSKLKILRSLMTPNLRHQVCRLKRLKALMRSTNVLRFSKKPKRKTTLKRTLINY